MMAGMTTRAANGARNSQHFNRDSHPGIIIGTVSLTGAHQFIGEFVEALSGGNLVVMLILVAVMSLILGMGLTTANYIVVSSLMAFIIVMVGAQNGLIVPLVAVHLFVFYFGILADDTPPVGLAAYACRDLKGDPIRTGVQGFSYDIRTAVLPFMFIFNTGILLIDVNFIEGVVIFLAMTVGMLAFCSATQHFIFIRNRIWETLALLLVAFTMFRPDYWLDQIVPH